MIQAILWSLVAFLLTFSVWPDAFWPDNETRPTELIVAFLAGFCIFIAINLE